MGTAQRSLWSSETSIRTTPIDAAVHWVCRGEAHQAAASRGGRGGLTVYRGRWAYCDGIVEDSEHEWAPTGGVAIDRLVDWARALDT